MKVSEVWAGHKPIVDNKSPILNEIYFALKD